MIATLRRSWRMLVTGRELYVRSRAMTASAGRFLFVSIAVAMGMLVSVRPVSADEGWTITSFHSDITIAPDSRLTIVEDIHVNFVQQHHGIFRTIPLRYRFDHTHARYYNLSVQSVTDGSRPWTYSAYVDSDNEVIKIGDPSATVGGDQRYVIT